MHKVIMSTAEPAYTREATGILVKIIDSTYARADLKQVADNANHMNDKERTQLPRHLDYFKGLFDGTLGNWDIYPVNLDINPCYKPFNSKYYTFPRINKETFRKDLKRLLKTGL